MKEWNIGDQVKVIDREAIPADRRVKIAGGDPALWTAVKSRLAGMVGEVVDKLYSEKNGCYVYKLQLVGFDRVSHAQFVCEDLEDLPKSKLRFEVEIFENVVCARLYDGDVQLGIGHGHVFHEGALGVMQAGSYAMKRCYENMGGTFPKGMCSDERRRKNGER